MKIEDAEMCIYQIIHKKSGKSYIGQTTKRLRERWNTHCRADSKCTKIKNAIQKYGKNAFKLKVLEVCEDVDSLAAREIYWIKTLSSISNGYNIQSGGRPKSYTKKVKIPLPPWPIITAEQWLNIKESNYSFDEYSTKFHSDNECYNT